MDGKSRRPDVLNIAPDDRAEDRPRAEEPQRALRRHTFGTAPLVRGYHAAQVVDIFWAGMSAPNVNFSGVYHRGRSGAQPPATRTIDGSSPLAVRPPQRRSIAVGSGPAVQPYS